MRINVSDKLLQHFWAEPGQGDAEFWAFRRRPKVGLGDTIEFYNQGKLIARAKVHRIERPGQSACGGTGRFKNHWKVVWRNRDFQDLREKSVSDTIKDWQKQILSSLQVPTNFYQEHCYGRTPELLLQTDPMTFIQGPSAQINNEPKGNQMEEHNIPRDSAAIFKSLEEAQATQDDAQRPLKEVADNPLADEPEGDEPEADKLAFPTPQEIQDELIGIRDSLEGTDEIDVRLQVEDNGTWTVHSGDPQYDTDHKGFWGASTVDPTDTDDELFDRADDLINQAKDAAAEAGFDVGDDDDDGEINDEFLDMVAALQADRDDEEKAKKLATEILKEMGYEPKDVNAFELQTGLNGFDTEGMKLEVGSEEWIGFKTSDQAKQYALEVVKQDLELEPGIFSQDFLMQHTTVSDTDARMLASDMADNDVDSMDDDEVVEQADKSDELEEIEDDITELEDQDEPDEKKIEDLEKKKQELIDAAKEEVRSEKQDEYEKEIKKDPVKFFVDERGIYTKEELFKQNFMSLNVDKAAEDAVDTDGVEHFLASYDGNELEVGDTVWYRHN